VRAVDCATDLICRACVGERPDDLVGDVDAAARPDDLLVLEHDVELFGLRDLPHGTIGALDDALELFLAPLPQILVEFPLLALELTVGVGEFPLALQAVGLGTSSPRSSPDLCIFFSCSACLESSWPRCENSCSSFFCAS